MTGFTEFYALYLWQDCRGVGKRGRSCGKGEGLGKKGRGWGKGGGSTCNTECHKQNIDSIAVAWFLHCQMYQSFTCMFM